MGTSASSGESEARARGRLDQAPWLFPMDASRVMAARQKPQRVGGGASVIVMVRVRERGAHEIFDVSVGEPVVHVFAFAAALDDPLGVQHAQLL